MLGLLAEKVFISAPLETWLEVRGKTAAEAGMSGPGCEPPAAET